MPRDLRTRAIVLRRTNYGESDRILNFITPEGKVSALAHGVRKEKSRLAGGIELFSVADIVVHQGRSDLGTLTSVKMLKFFGGILGDMTRLELAATFLKKLERAAEQTDNPDFFDILNQALAGLDRGYLPALVSAWFNFNFARTTGEEINLICDVQGTPLTPDQTYIWDELEAALRPHPAGPIGAKEIKLARLLWSTKLQLVANIENVDELILPICDLAKAIAKY